jgi:hypothetical protein
MPDSVFLDLFQMLMHVLARQPKASAPPQVVAENYPPMAHTGK